jgi:DNA-binding CsgD family transcriptional regulator
VAIVFVTDPEQRMATSAEILQLLFELTRAESRLAIALLDGKSLHEAAELIGVARETVRSQIKSIFQKTGTQRQGELIRLLSQLPATVSAESE